GSVPANLRGVDPELLASRRGPLEQLLGRLHRRDLGAAREVYHAPVETVPERPPEVLLDLAGTQRRRQGARVVVERGLGHAGAHQARQSERLVAVALGVADPHLDGSEAVMGPDAPPELGRLDDRART